MSSSSFHCRLLNDYNGARYLAVTCLLVLPEKCLCRFFRENDFWRDVSRSCWTSVYRGFWGISCCVKVDSDPACRCGTTGARGPSLSRARRRQRWYGWFCWFRRISRCVGFSKGFRFPGGFHQVARCSSWTSLMRPCGGDSTGADLGQLDKVSCCCGATTGLRARQWLSLCGGAAITGDRRSRRHPCRGEKGRHSLCPYIPASWPMKLRPRSSSTTCSWLVLLITLHFALRSFDYRQAPRSSSTTVTGAWQVLLVTMHITLCSLCFSAGPRYSASWLVWKRKSVCSDDARFFDSFLRHFSHSVQGDVDCQGGGDTGVCFPGVLPPELDCKRAVVSTKTSLSQVSSEPPPPPRPPRPHAHHHHTHHTPPHTTTTTPLPPFPPTFSLLPSPFSLLPSSPLPPCFAPLSLSLPLSLSSPPSSSPPVSVRPSIQAICIQSRALREVFASDSGLASKMGSQGGSMVRTRGRRVTSK